LKPDIEVLEPRERTLFSDFYEPLRQTRRERRAPAGTHQRSAVLTIARNEAVFLPIWLGYYSRFFAPEDIYVLDHGTTDGSTDVGGFVRIPVEHDTVDNTWMRARVQSQQCELLESYDVVLTVDSDEIVSPDPDWGTLEEYLAGFQEEFVTCLGYEVIHLPDREPPLDLSRPVLEQRGHWFVAAGYDKPAVATAPTPWAMGFHGRTDGEIAIDPDLRLIHLHRMDYEICRDRHRTWSEWEWNSEDLEKGWGRHNRISGDEEFDRWYFTGHCFEYAGDERPVIERIPGRWRSVV
jgi:hypothetical protein